MPKSSGSCGDIPKYSNYSLSAVTHTHSHTHTSAPQPTLPPQERRLPSAECTEACHRRSETLTISEFTSAQAQGSARSDRPPNSLVIKDKDSRGGRRREREKGASEGKERRGREERSVAISFQTVLLKCAEMTQAFRYSGCTQL